jgi:hypothetical protein
MFYPCGFHSRSLLGKGDDWVRQCPSFPHVFSGNPDKTRTGPPIETFGGDEFGACDSGLSIPMAWYGAFINILSKVNRSLLNWEANSG